MDKRNARRPVRRTTKAHSIILAAAASAVMGHAASPSANAASATWNGTTNSTWATSSNWSAATPGTGDTATFNNAGNGNTTMDLGAGVTANTLVFDTASAAAYTIGSGLVGSQTLTLNDGGAVTMNSTVANNELFNANVILGTDATTQSYTFTNNATTNSLTFVGNISGGSGGVVGTETLTIAGAGQTNISGVIGNGGATVALTMAGSGTLSLTTTNGYTGASTVNNGTLLLDFSSTGTPTNLINSSSSLTLGGGTLSILGNPTLNTAQTFASLTLTANTGSSAIILNPNAGSGTTLTLSGTWTRNAGDTLNIDLADGGMVNGALATTMAAGTLGWATVTDATGVGFAHATGSGVVRLTNATGLTTAATTATIDYVLATSTTPSLQLTASQSVNTLTLDSTATDGTLDLNAKTLTLTSNGLLMTDGGTGNGFTITGGQLGASSKELIIHQMSTGGGMLTISSAISGLAGSLTKDGPGIVVLDGSASNTYSGPTTVNAGELDLNMSGSFRAIGTGGGLVINSGGLVRYGMLYNPAAYTGQIGSSAGTITINGTGQLDFNGSIDAVSNVIVVSAGAGTNTMPITNSAPGGGGNLTIANLTITPVSGYVTDVDPGYNGTITVTGTITSNATSLGQTEIGATAQTYLVLGGASATTINVAAGGNTSYDMAINASITSGAKGLDKTGSGILLLTGSNYYTGATTITTGVLSIGSEGAIPGGANSLIFAGGTLQYTAGNNSNLFDPTPDIKYTGSPAIKIDLNGQEPVNFGSTKISGSGSLTVLDSAGGGTLPLSTLNTYTGGTNIDGGTVSLEAADTAGTNGPLGKSGTISFGGGTLQYTYLNNTDYSSRFSIAANQEYSIDTNGWPITFSHALTSSGGSLTVLDSSVGGILNLKAANTYTGATNIDGGTVSLQFADSGTNGPLGKGGTINFNGGTLQYYSSVNHTDYSSRFSTAANQLYKIDVNGQAVTFASGLTSSGGSLSLSNSTTGGSLTLTGQSTYTGATTINSGGALVLSFSSTTPTNIISSTSLLTMNGGTLSLLGASTGNSAQTFSGLTLLGGSNSIMLSPTGAGSTTLTLNGTFTIDPGATMNFNLLAGAIIYSNLSPQTLAWATVTENGTTGVAYANGTQIVPLAPIPLSSSSNNGAIDFYIEPSAAAPPTVSTTGSPYITLNAGLNPSYHSLTINTSMATGPNYFDLNGNTVTVTSTVTSSALVMSGGQNFVIQNGQFGASGSVLFATVGGPGSLTITGTVTGGSGGVTKSGAGTLVLAASNTYTGTTNITGGILNVGSAEGTNRGPIGNGGLISFNGGTLQYSSANHTDYSFRFSTASGQNFNIDTNGEPVTFATPLTSAGGSLTVSDSLGTGTLTLTGLSNYTGATTINSGAMLQLGNGTIDGIIDSTTPGNGTSNIVNNGTLYLLRTSHASITSPEVISGAGTLIVNSVPTTSMGQTFTGVEILTASNTYTGPTIINPNGNLQLGDGLGSSTDGTINKSSSIDVEGALILNHYGSAVVTTPQITGGSGGNIYVYGPAASGAEILTNPNSTFAGTTTIYGTLQLGDGMSAGNNGNFTSTTGGLIDNDGSLIFNRVGSSTLAIPITSDNGLTAPAGSVTITGGTQVLTASNSYTGATTINSMTTLQLGDGTLAGNAGSIEGTSLLTNSGTLVFNRFGPAPSAPESAVPITGSGNVIVTGTGTQILVGSSSYTGQTTINAGATLQIGDGVTDGNISTVSSIVSNMNVLVTQGTSNIVNNGTLYLWRAVSPITSPEVISGSGTVIIDGTVGGGTQIFTGANTYTGPTYITANGILQLGDGMTMAGDSGQIEHSGTLLGAAASVHNGGLLIFNRFGAVTSNIIIADGTMDGTPGGMPSAGSVQIGDGTSTGTQILTAVSTYSGTTNILGGATLQLASGGSINNSTTIDVEGTLAFNNAGTMSAAISGMAGSVVVQAGTQILTGQSPNFFGAVTIASGTTLQLGDGMSSLNDGTIDGTSGVAINGTGTLVFNRVGKLTTGMPISGTGGVTVKGALGSYQALTGENTYSGNTLVTNFGTLLANSTGLDMVTFAPLSSTGSGNVTVSSSGTLGGGAVGVVGVGNAGQIENYSGGGSILNTVTISNGTSRATAGSIAPGNPFNYSGANLASATDADTGTLSIAGNLTLDGSNGSNVSGGTYYWKVDASVAPGAIPGTQDMINAVALNIDPSGGTFNLSVQEIGSPNTITTGATYVIAQAATITIHGSNVTNNPNVTSDFVISDTSLLGWNVSIVPDPNTGGSDLEITSTGPVPEPGSLGVLAIASLGLLRRNRSRRSS